MNGAPTLGAAYEVLREQWESGERDRELALHLMFLAWYLNVEPPHLTGLDDAGSARTRVQMTMRYAHLAPEVARDAVRLLDANETRGKTVAKTEEKAAI